MARKKKSNDDREDLSQSDGRRRIGLIVLAALMILGVLTPMYMPGGEDRDGKLIWATWQMWNETQDPMVRFYMAFPLVAGAAVLAASIFAGGLIRGAIAWTLGLLAWVIPQARPTLMGGPFRLPIGELETLVKAVILLWLGLLLLLSSFRIRVYAGRHRLGAMLGYAGGATILFTLVAPVLPAEAGTVPGGAIGIGVVKAVGSDFAAPYGWVAAGGVACLVAAALVGLINVSWRSSRAGRTGSRVGSLFAVGFLAAIVAIPLGLILGQAADRQHLLAAILMAIKITIWVVPAFILLLPLGFAELVLGASQALQESRAPTRRRRRAA